MSNQPTVQSILADLGGSSAVAKKIRRPPGTVAAWKSRDVLPPESWRDIVALAMIERVPGVTYDRLHELYYGEKCDAGR